MTWMNRRTLTLRIRPRRNRGEEEEEQAATYSEHEVLVEDIRIYFLVVLVAA